MSDPSDLLRLPYCFHNPTSRILYNVVKLYESAAIFVKKSIIGCLLISEKKILHHFHSIFMRLYAKLQYISNI